MNKISFTSIGLIRSGIKNPEGAPIQPSGAVGIKGRAELDPAFQEGLKDLDGFSHLILLYHLHLSEGYALTVKPFLDDNQRGLFATRAPRRPNPIGLSVVRLEKIEGPVLHLLDVDIVDGTPLLDLKPYVPKFDSKPEALSGWLTDRAQAAEGMKSDDRFRKNGE